MTDKTVRRAASKLVAKQSLQDRNAIKTIMESYDGRMWMFRLLESCHVSHNPFSRDALKMSFDCGELNIGLMLQSMIFEHSPQQYFTMLREAKEEQRNGNERSANDSDGTAANYGTDLYDSGRYDDLNLFGDVDA